MATLTYDISGSFQSQEVDDIGDAAQMMLASKRRSFSREEKLRILKYYYENGCNKYKTCQEFGIAKPCLYRWLETENQIQDGRKGSKRVEGGGRKAFWPDVEEKLVAEFKELRAKGLRVKQYWFRTRAVQLMNELHPDVNFKFSPGWFDRFKARNEITRRRSTPTNAPENPTDMEEKIREFHLEIQRVAASKDSDEPLGKFKLSTVANVDQSPLYFSFSGGQGCDEAKTVVSLAGPSVSPSEGLAHETVGTSSALDACQCTVQLTIFADGEPRVPPLLIFRGEGLKISQAEEGEYDKRVSVQFQESMVWCDEVRMLYWIDHMWKCPSSPDVDNPKLLIADMRKTPKTSKVLDALKTCKTTVVFVPPSLTNLVQPLDVIVNRDFKQIVDRMQTEHVLQNLEQYANNSLSGSQRRILITKWIGTAWEEVSLKKDVVRRGFEKWGISVPSGGGGSDEAVNICGLDSYTATSDTDTEIDRDGHDHSELESSSDEKTSRSE